MHPAEPPAVDTVLVPVDASDESITALEYAVSVADRYDAAVHVVYVLGDVVAQGVDAGVIEEADVAEDARSVLEAAAGIASAHDVPLSTSTAHGFSSRRKTRHPGSVVLDTAEAVGAGFIVVPREAGDDDPANVLETAAEYALLYASQPVLSV